MPQQPAANPLGTPFIELQSVDSTNNYALERVHAGLAQHGEAFFAHQQVAGKGQRGRAWVSEKDASIVLSVVAKPPSLQLTQQFQFSAFVAVATREFFAQYAGNDTRIKWPNDLYWQDRKAGGVLIESGVQSRESGVDSRESIVISPESSPGATSPDSRLPTPDSRLSTPDSRLAVIGIGININQTLFPSGLPNPVSLKQITGKNFNPVELAKELCHALDKRYRELVNGGFDTIYDEYLEYLYKKNEVVRLKKDSRVFEATIKSVSPSGRLVIQHAIEEEYDFGEIEWVI